MLDKYVQNRVTGLESEEEKQAIADFFYQIIMRRGTTEYAILIMFNPTLTAHLPLGTPDKLGNPDFPVPISFFYGDEDWVANVDEDAA